MHTKTTVTTVRSIIVFPCRAVSALSRLAATASATLGCFCLRSKRSFNYAQSQRVLCGVQIGDPYFTIFSSRILLHLIHRRKHSVNIPQRMPPAVLRRREWHLAHIFNDRFLLKYYAGYNVQLIEDISDVRDEVGLLSNIEQFVVAIVVIRLDDG